MEGPLENWISEMEMDEEDIFNQSQSHINSFNEQEEFLREILQDQEFSPTTENPFPNPCSTIQNNHSEAILEGGATCPSNISLSFDGNGTLHKSKSINSIMSLDKYPTSPTTYLLSFDSPSVEPIIHEPSSNYDSTFGSKKWDTGGDDFEEQRVKQGRKRKGRTEGHIMAERKRRQELSGSIVALSATIPGLKKIDKVYVLTEALNYIKQLQEHVKEMGNQNKERRVEPTILIRKSQASANKRTTNCETNSDIGGRSTESPLEIEARVLVKEVLIRIRYCERQKDTMHKIHVFLEKLHLSISSSSLLPFGASTHIITVIAQMHDEYIMKMDDLVNSLREELS